MSLQKILLDIGSEAGLDMSNPEQKALAIKLVNDVAKEIYEAADLLGALREITVNIDSDASQSSMVSLPSYVDQIRGVKYSSIPGGKIPINDMRPRYFGGRGWGGNIFSLPYRVVREMSPLKRDISNASILTFIIPEAESSDIVITLTGATTNASRSTETITIVAGTLSVDTIGNFIDIENIEKSAPNNNDITVTDIEDNELSIIPNNQIKPSYKWIELQDANANLTQVNINLTFSAIDVLFKPLFTPFVNLYDEFQAGPKYDRAIFYKFMEYYLAGQEGQENRAMRANGKSKQLINQINTDSDEGRILEVQWGREGYADAQNPYSYYKTGMSRRDW